MDSWNHVHVHELTLETILDRWILIKLSVHVAISWLTFCCDNEVDRLWVSLNGLVVDSSACHNSTVELSCCWNVEDWQSVTGILHWNQFVVDLFESGCISDVVCTDTVDHPDQFEANPCYTLELSNVWVIEVAVGWMQSYHHCGSGRGRDENCKSRNKCKIFLLVKLPILRVHYLGF